MEIRNRQKFEGESFGKRLFRRSRKRYEEKLELEF
jgi:hypothetical protein